MPSSQECNSTTLICPLTPAYRAGSRPALILTKRSSYSKTPRCRRPDRCGGASRQVMKLPAVHRFETPGTVVLSCADGVTAPVGSFDQNTLFTHLRIIAMKVSSIANVVLGQ